MDFWLGVIVGWIASVALHALLEASMRWRRREQWRERDEP